MFNATFAINVLVRGMIERGRDVNVISMGASMGTPTRAAYAATKATLESLTRNWAVEFAKEGIRERTHRHWLQEGLRVLSTGVAGTVGVLRRRNWRVFGTWVEILATIGALWAARIAVGEHFPFAVVTRWAT